MTRTLLSLLSNQGPNGLLHELSPPCKDYLAGLIDRAITRNFNEVDKTMIDLSGKFINELGKYQSCMSTPNMAYYLVQAGADIVRVNVGICFRDKCTDQDWTMIRNFLYTKLYDKINKPGSMLYKAAHYLVLNINRVQRYTKNYLPDPVSNTFFLIFGAFALASLVVSLKIWWRGAMADRKKGELEPVRIKQAVIPDNEAQLSPSQTDSFSSTQTNLVVNIRKTVRDRSISQIPNLTSNVVLNVDTFIDSTSQAKDLSILNAFSLQHNWNTIHNYQVNNPQQLTVDVLRILSYFGVMSMNMAFCHALISKLFTDTVTRTYYLHGFKHTTLQGSLFIPDLLLFLGGYIGIASVLRVYERIDVTKQKWRYPLVHGVLLAKRFFRYSLGLFLAMAFIWKILPLVSHGPLSVSDLGCSKRNFLASVFLINSTFGGNGTGMCGNWYWYPAMDFQLFLLVPFIGFLYKLYPRIALAYTGLLTVIGISVTAIYNQVNSIKAVNDHNVTWITNCMTISYTRAFCYFLGCFCFLYRQYQSKESLVSKLYESQNETLSLATLRKKKKQYELAIYIGLFIFLVDGTIFFVYFQAYRHNLWYPQWKHTLFNTFAPSGFAISAVLVFGGLVHRFYAQIYGMTQYAIFKVLRAVYFEVFLVAVPFILWVFFNFQSIPAFNSSLAYMSLIWETTGCIGVALIFYLLVSRPYKNLLNKIFRL